MPIETVMLTALDGVELQADVARADTTSGPVIGGVVLAHPHPLYGGNRYNPIIGELFRILPAAGFDTVRFDFRGVGQSAGAHDDGDSERLDIVAGIDLLEQIDDSGSMPIWLVGYSFGAVTSLNVVDPRVEGWVAIAPPLAVAGRCLADGDPRHKLVVVPELDQFSPPAKSAETMDGWANTEMRTVAGVDHFLGSAVSAIAADVRDQLISPRR